MSATPVPEEAPPPWPAGPEEGRGPFDPSEVLRGRLVRLEPWGPGHAREMAIPGGTGPVEPWRGIPSEAPRATDLLRPEDPAVGPLLPWTAYAVRGGLRGPLVGSLVLEEIDLRNRSITARPVRIAPAWTGLGLERDAGWALLSHAFERVGVHRVGWRVRATDAAGRASVEAIGSVPEASLRDRRRSEGGGWETELLYGILRAEWPVHRERLWRELPGSTVPPAPPRAAPVVPPEPDPGEPPPRWASSFRGPVVLQGPSVELVPMEARWSADLWRALRDPEVWRWLRFAPPTSEEAMRTLVEAMLSEWAQGSLLPFVVHSRRLDRAVGVFRYLHIDRRDGAVEFGTWLDPAVWRTGVNRETKWLALRHAFEDEGFRRVEFRTDRGNLRSRAAIEGLGATFEGEIREHVWRGAPGWRTSRVYSILATEWPALRGRLDPTARATPARSGAVASP
ncbi:MAG: GNAT family protein [Thermoplasmata archaeon]